MARPALLLATLLGVVLIRTPPRRIAIEAGAKPCNTLEAGALAKQGKRKTLPCRIQITPTGTVLRANSSGNNDPLDPIVMNSSGRMVSGSLAGIELLMWEADGAFGRRIGREGDGPGEFRSRPYVAFDRWDTLHVFDVATRRWSVFDPTFMFVRSARVVNLAGGRFSALLPNGTLIYGLPRHPSYTFDVLLKGADTTRRIGNPPSPEETFMPRRHLGAIDDTSFWATPEHVLRLERWTVSGRRTRVIDVALDEFPRRNSDSGFMGVGSPVPLVDYIFPAAADGVIWVKVMLPEKGNSVPPERSPARSRRGMTRDVADRLYDFILIAVEPVSGAVIGALRTRDRADNVEGFLKDGTGYQVIEDDDGRETYRVVQVHLVAASE